MDALVANMAAAGLRTSVLVVKPEPYEDGIQGPRDYEGGFVMIVAQHADGPAPAWHRDDLGL